MSRSERLLNLLQLLRRHPVSGTAMADELQVSLRILYRDIATLRARGAGIEGAPGLGPVLRAGFVLPPLMFTVDEIEALVLGTCWVSGRGDSRLGAAARDALAKIAAVLPPPKLRREHDAWQAKGLPVVQPPTDMDFGHTFVALDPDGHRLRVFAAG